MGAWFMGMGVIGILIVLHARSPKVVRRLEEDKRETVVTKKVNGNGKVRGNTSFGDFASEEQFQEALDELDRYIIK